MKKVDFERVFGVLLVFALVFGGVAVFNQTQTGASENPVAQVEKNKMTKGTWDLTVSKVEFLTSQGDQKSAAVTMEITNPAGKDVPVLPSGYIYGFVGSSGKTYLIEKVNPDLQRDYELGKQVKNGAEFRKAEMQKAGKEYQAGSYKISFVQLVDVTEDNITGVIYEDKNGSQVTIPVNVQPTTRQAEGL